jgi:hypothetical protein
MEKVLPLGQYKEPLCPDCMDKMEQVLKGHGGFRFKMMPGKTNGVYEYDYGKKATWDLTAPGKMERLKKEGRINDPFDAR